MQKFTHIVIMFMISAAIWIPEFLSTSNREISYNYNIFLFFFCSAISIAL